MSKYGVNEIETWSPMETIPRDGRPVLVLSRDRQTIGLGSILSHAFPATDDMPPMDREQVAWFGRRRGDDHSTIWMGGDKITEAVGWRDI